MTRRQSDAVLISRYAASMSLPTHADAINYAVEMWAKSLDGRHHRSKKNRLVVRKINEQWRVYKEYLKSPPRPRVTCPFCDASVAVNGNGRLYKHNIMTKRVCVGSGRLAAT